MRTLLALLMVCVVANATLACGHCQQHQYGTVVDKMATPPQSVTIDPPPQTITVDPPPRTFTYDPPDYEVVERHAPAVAATPVQTYCAPVQQYCSPCCAPVYEVYAAPYCCGDGMMMSIGDGPPPLLRCFVKWRLKRKMSNATRLAVRAGYPVHFAP